MKKSTHKTSLVLAAALAALAGLGSLVADRPTEAGTRAGAARLSEAGSQADGGKPLQEWWPSQWGPEDQRGAANRLTPAKAIEAAKLIKKGRIYQLGRVYEPGIPMPGSRHYSLWMQGSPTDGPLGRQHSVAMSEVFSGEIGQIGTQFDGLGHMGARLDGVDRFYNGFSREENLTPKGWKKLGVENVGAFFTRGVLLDIAGSRNLGRLPPSYHITVADIEACLKWEGIEIHPGDVVLIRTGHGQHWMKDNEAYSRDEPGIGLGSAQWLADRGVVLIGADNYGIEVKPHEDPSLYYPVHVQDLAVNGIYHLESLDLEALAADKVYQFAFMFSPLPLKGATGSPGNPIAVH